MFDQLWPEVVLALLPASQSISCSGLSGRGIPVNPFLRPTYISAIFFLTIFAHIREGHLTAFFWQNCPFVHICSALFLGPLWARQQTSICQQVVWTFLFTLWLLMCWRNIFLVDFESHLLLPNHLPEVPSFDRKKYHEVIIVLCLDFSFYPQELSWEWDCIASG